jgi:hypothetical protein
MENVERIRSACGPAPALVVIAICIVLLAAVYLDDPSKAGALAVVACIAVGVYLGRRERLEHTGRVEPHGSRAVWGLLEDAELLTQDPRFSRQALGRILAEIEARVSYHKLLLPEEMCRRITFLKTYL